MMQKSQIMMIPIKIGNINSISLESRSWLWKIIYITECSISHPWGAYQRYPPNWSTLKKSKNFTPLSMIYFCDPTYHCRLFNRFLQSSCWISWNIRNSRIYTLSNQLALTFLYSQSMIWPHPGPSFHPFLYAFSQGHAFYNSETP